MLRIFSVVFLAASVVFSLYSFYYSGKILPRVFIASLNVSGLSKRDAADKIQTMLAHFSESGIPLLIDGKSEVIDPKNIELKLPTGALVNDAWSLGRSGKWHEQLGARIIAPFSTSVFHGRIEINEQKLESELALIAVAYDVERKDIRYDIKDRKVSILYETEPGKLLDKEEAKRAILAHISEFNISPVQVVLKIDSRIADPASGKTAKAKVEKMMAEPLFLSYSDKKYKVASEEIGKWIISRYEENKLVPGLNRKLISEYVVSIAEKIDIVPQSSAIKVEEAKVIEFVPPKDGRAILQDETIALIESSLYSRAEGGEVIKELSVPVVLKKPAGEGASAGLGIVELIGKAVTPFTGSPSNRIHNIKNGVRFLNGLLIAPGEEFSTVSSLGKIDNSTGYLPELVIKGDETTPEFGGGLCQVSTTLFRAVMNAGLPVLERRNHSYRVPYYERDGEGNLIGPGLDATIYDPFPDFKFKNDTSAHILIQGYVEDDKARFELYGTGDDRKSFIDGPHTLKETPSPDPVYIETQELAKGEKKKIDTAHPGGIAVATYKIEYPDGRMEEQEFKSYYRPWPEKWLVGTATSTIVR